MRMLGLGLVMVSLAIQPTASLEAQVSTEEPPNRVPFSAELHLSEGAPQFSQIKIGKSYQQQEEEVRRIEAEKKATFAPPIYSTDHNALLAAAGIAQSDWYYVDYIVMREGHYDPCVINGGAVNCAYAVNGGQKAYGVCQSLPGYKMASAGADWATNPITQLKWCNSYAYESYGGWANSYLHWLRFSWW